jgi:D-lactate dehydrogenase (cytochrome)
MHRDGLGHARYLVAEHKRIVMTLPLPLESVGPAARDAAIASLHELLGDRLSSAAPALTFRIRFVRDISIHTPPRNATRLPSKPVPAPNGIIGTLFRAQSLDDIAHLLSRLREGDSVRRYTGVIGCILSVLSRAGDLDGTVDAGVTHEQLNEHLRDTGLFFSVDLGAKVHLADRTVSESVAKTQSLKFAPGTVELHLA